MEIELKYLIPDYEIAGDIWNQDSLDKYGKVDSVKQTEMFAVYYDTEDDSLSSVSAAFRIRRENDKTIATIKWGGYQEDSLHEREEINIPLNSAHDLKKPSLKVFEESEKGRELIAIVGDKPLIPMIETKFIRNAMRLDTGAAICEVSLDVGEIMTKGGNDDILELEIELFSGDVKEIMEIGRDLQKRFGLVPGEISKFGRGKELLNKYRRKEK